MFADFGDLQVIVTQVGKKFFRTTKIALVCCPPTPPAKRNCVIPCPAAPDPERMLLKMQDKLRLR